MRYQTALRPDVTSRWAGRQTASLIVPDSIPCGRSAGLVDGLPIYGLFTLPRRWRRKPIFLSFRNEESAVVDYWSDERRQNQEKWPRPFGLRRKSGVPNDEVAGVEIRLYVVLALDGGVTTILGLEPRLHPRTKTYPQGPRIWPDFRSRRHPPG